MKKQKKVFKIKSFMKETSEIEEKESNNKKKENILITELREMFIKYDKFIDEHDNNEIESEVESLESIIQISKDELDLLKSPTIYLSDYKII